ncbi:transcription factor bHLH168-like [Wolffia australiana]
MKRREASAPVERKTVEKNRRIHMKALCLKLSSLVPEGNLPKDSLTQQDHLEQAAGYIRCLKERIEGLKQKKGLLIDGHKNGCRPMVGLHVPLLEIRALESTLEVVLICVPARRSLFYLVIAVLEEEGADVTNASFSIVNEKIFYTIHAQVRCPRIGLETSRLTDRLRELVSHG